MLMVLEKVFNLFFSWNSDPGSISDPLAFSNTLVRSYFSFFNSFVLNFVASRLLTKLYLCGNIILSADSIILLIVPISHDLGEFGLVIIYCLFLYLLIRLFDFSIAASFIVIPTFSFSMSSLSESGTMSDADVVGGGGSDGCVDGGTNGAAVGLDFGGCRVGKPVGLWLCVDECVVLCSFGAGVGIPNGGWHF